MSENYCKDCFYKVRVDGCTESVSSVCKRCYECRIKLRLDNYNKLLNVIFGGELKL